MKYVVFCALLAFVGCAQPVSNAENNEGSNSESDSGSTAMGTTGGPVGGPSPAGSPSSGTTYGPDNPPPGTGADLSQQSSAMPNEGNPSSGNVGVPQNSPPNGTGGASESEQQSGGNTQTTSGNPNASPTDEEILIRVGPRHAWTHRSSGYVFSMGQPRGFKNARDDIEQTYFEGDIYQAATGTSTIRKVRVYIRKLEGEITLEEALENEVAKQSELHTSAVASETERREFGGLEFLCCDLELQNEYLGRGDAFLYTAFDGEFIVTINAEEFDGGDPVRLVIARASAMTFESLSDRRR